MMSPKPRHLRPEYGSQFADQSVVDCYHLRPAYPEGVLAILADLVHTSCGRVLDLGTGTGEIARRFAPLVDHVDAVDISAPMIERAQERPGGDSDRITWIVGPAETAPLHPPYGLVTAAASLHWMEWDIVLPRIRDVLAPGGFLACVDMRDVPVPWLDELMPVIARYSTNREFRPYNTVDELEQRGLFRPVGRARTAVETVTQSIADYIGAIHARNGFSLNRMTVAAAMAFDVAAAELLAPYATNDHLTFEIAGEVIWGLPLSPDSVPSQTSA